MGVRNNSNIKVVRKSLLNPTIKQILSNSFFFIDPTKVISADLSVANKYIDVDYVLTDSEIKTFHEIITDAKKNTSYDYRTPLELLYRAFKSFLVSPNISKLNWQYDELKFESFINAMTAMGLLYGRPSLNFYDNIYSTTSKAHEFFKIVNKNHISFPFDWDNHIVYNYNYPNIENQPFLSLEKNGQKYLINFGIYSKEMSKVFNRKYTFEVYLDVNDEQTKNKTFTDYNEFLKNVPLDQKKLIEEVVNKTRENNKHTQLEVIPLMTDVNHTFLEGTHNDEPVFIKMTNTSMEHCRNLYGDKLSMVFDYDSICETANGSYGTVYVVKNGQVVYITNDAKILARESNDPYLDSNSTTAYNMLKYKKQNK